MRKRLLSQPIHSTSLHKLLVLITMLLVPQLAGAEDYPLFIAGTQVTDANATDITGTGTVSYDADNYILTLNGATINGTIESSLDNLSIHYIYYIYFHFYYSNHNLLYYLVKNEYFRHLCIRNSY